MTTSIKFTGCFSREQVIDFYPVFAEIPCSLISITDPYSSPPEINGKWADVLCLTFWDTIDGDSALVSTFPPVNPEQIKEMYDFIVAHKSHHIYAHCEAGISRSGAIVEFLNRRGWTVDVRTRILRNPNILVLNGLNRLDRKHTIEWTKK